MHRKGYTKRCLGHRGQEIYNNALKDCEKFLFDIIKLRKQYKFDIKNILYLFGKYPLYLYIGYFLDNFQ